MASTKNLAKSGEIYHAAKADRAEALLVSGGVASVQVLNEFASVATRKLTMTIPEIREILSTIRAVCVVRSLDIETHDLGSKWPNDMNFQSMMA